MNIEVDVYKALEALLLQECSGDAIVDDDDDEKTFASKNVSVSRVRLAMLSEEKTTLRNTCVVVVKYGRSFESKVHLDRLGFMVSDDESVSIPVPSNDDDDDDGDALVFEVWSEDLLLGIGKTTRLQKETVVKIRNPLSKKDTTVAILAIVVV